jgi:hypothetical protein
MRLGRWSATRRGPASVDRLYGHRAALQRAAKQLMAQSDCWLNALHEGIDGDEARNQKQRQRRQECEVNHVRPYAESWRLHVPYGEKRHIAHKNEAQGSEKKNIVSDTLHIGARDTKVHNANERQADASQSSARREQRQQHIQQNLRIVDILQHAVNT